jgi:cobalamin biosynthesis Co2+ chelatase CbiK
VCGDGERGTLAEGFGVRPWKHGLGELGTVIVIFLDLQVAAIREIRGWIWGRHDVVN